MTALQGVHAVTWRACEEARLALLADPRMEPEALVRLAGVIAMLDRLNQTLAPLVGQPTQSPSAV